MTGGWAFPMLSARKAHYFPAPEGDSLCRRYRHVDRLAGPLDPSTASSVDDCAACRRKLNALTESARKGQ